MNQPEGVQIFACPAEMARDNRLPCYLPGGHAFESSQIGCGHLGSCFLLHVSPTKGIWERKEHGEKGCHGYLTVASSYIHHPSPAVRVQQEFHSCPRDQSHL